MSKEIAIVGAGPVGAVLALLLAQRGHRVDVFEARFDPRTHPPRGGRSINLTLAERGWKAFREVGVADAIEDLTIPLKGRLIHGEDGQDRFQPYSSRGDAIFSASRSEVSVRLVELATQHENITVHFNHRCRDVDVEARKLFVRESNGNVRTVEPDLVFAADGAWSQVKRCLTRRDDFHAYQRISPLMYRELRVPATPDGDWAFDKNALHLWPRGDCMIVAFPNVDRTYTVSIFMPATGPLSFASLSSRTEIHDFFRTSCPDLFERAADLVYDFFGPPPSMLVSGGCGPWVHGDWLALIGDAAHALVPFLGQGLNAGLEDCSVLAECIDRNPGDWATTFEEYQADRQPNSEAIIRMAEDHFNKLARGARDPDFVLRRALEEEVHRVAPESFEPFYQMVAFGDRPYLEIEGRQARNEAVLDKLVARPGIREAVGTPAIDDMIRAAITEEARAPRPRRERVTSGWGSARPRVPGGPA
jgi:kynurenine 3-monooxygenase